MDFALVCATHAELNGAVAQGRFRSDLYYRINGFSVRLPALRQREDFEALAQRILSQWDDAGVRIAPDLLQAMRGYDWPGNLRQLASVLQTACALRDPATESAIDWPHLASDLRDALLSAPSTSPTTNSDVVNPSGDRHSQGFPSRATPSTPLQARPPTPSPAGEPAIAGLRKITEQAIHEALAQSGGNVSEASRRLSISRQTIYRLLRASTPNA